MWAILLLLIAANPVEAKSPKGKIPTRLQRAPSHQIESYPFIKKLQQQKTVIKKLEHLRSWNQEAAKENHADYYIFESLVRLRILSHEKEGHIDCGALHYDLDKYMYHRYESEGTSYIMFNQAADDLCPVK